MFWGLTLFAQWFVASAHHVVLLAFLRHLCFDDQAPRRKVLNEVGVGEQPLAVECVAAKHKVVFFARGHPFLAPCAEGVIGEVERTVGSPFNVESLAIAIQVVLRIGLLRVAAVLVVARGNVLRALQKPLAREQGFVVVVVVAA